MNINKNATKNYDAMLRNYSQVNCLNRLSDPDSETSSTLTAGGDESFIDEDINEQAKFEKEK